MRQSRYVFFGIVNVPKTTCVFFQNVRYESPLQMCCFKLRDEHAVIINKGKRLFVTLVLETLTF